MTHSPAPVTVTDRDAVRIVTVDRPSKLNALDAATLDALSDAFAAAAEDPSVRCVVLTGAGPKAFVAGADIAEMNGLTPVQGRDFSLRGQRLMRRIEKLPKPRWNCACWARRSMRRGRCNWASSTAWCPRPNWKRRP